MFRHHPVIVRLQGDLLTNDPRANQPADSPYNAVASAARHIGNGAGQAPREITRTATQEATEVGVRRAAPRGIVLQRVGTASDGCRALRCLSWRCAA